MYRYSIKNMVSGVIGYFSKRFNEKDVQFSIGGIVRIKGSKGSHPHYNTVAELSSPYFYGVVVSEEEWRKGIVGSPN